VMVVRHKIEAMERRAVHLPLTTLLRLDRPRNHFPLPRDLGPALQACRSMGKGRGSTRAVLPHGDAHTSRARFELDASLAHPGGIRCRGLFHAPRQEIAHRDASGLDLG
jgi:hypothetical protein